MNKTLSSKQWFRLVLGLTVAILVLLAAFTWLFDPFLYYRIPTHKMLVKSRFATAGILKNGDYDTAIIGSSMIQNYNMESFRNKLNWNTCKLTIGGINITELEMLFAKAARKDEIKRIILNVDLLAYNYEVKPQTRFPEYLYDDIHFNDFKYWWGYEVWTKFIPFDLGINMANKVGLRLPAEFEDATSIDKIEDWSKDYKFGQDIVIKNYLHNAYGVSEQNVFGMYERMVANFDNFAEETLQNSNGKEVIITFPPYSALFWYDAKSKGYFDTLLQFKEYIVANVAGLENVTVHDFQDMASIVDLQVYKDVTHYSPVINEEMVEELKGTRYVIDEENFAQRKERFIGLITQFEMENKHWLPQI